MPIFSFGSGVPTVFTVYEVPILMDCLAFCIPMCPHMYLIIVRIRCTKKMFRNKILAYIAKSFSGAQYSKFVTSKIKSVMQHLHFSFVNVAANWRLYFWLFFHACTILWRSVISNRKGPSTYIEAMKKNGQQQPVINKKKYECTTYTGAALARQSS